MRANEVNQPKEFEMTLVGQSAPEWCATAYLNGEETDISSDQYEGKWHVIYWYPLDFTFVCPTEIRGFQSLVEEFSAADVAVIGASTDSFFSHKHWFGDREIFPNEITHPVVADTNHALSRAFGVLKEDQGIAYRATVVVDDQGLIRSVSTNDLSAGRSPAEALRTVQALQSGGLCAMDWRPGEAFVG
jgi:peroxiredoxin (alkyl hydroperoxide reductase subunit C)